MNNDIHSPHDKLFKDTFSRKDAAISYLQSFLPEEIQSHTDFDSLQVYPGEYIDSELKGSFSDLVYKVNINNNPAYLYLLFEHQSTAETLMAFRFTHLWDKILKGQSQAKRLPAILPLVLYQGKAIWSAPLQLNDLIEKPNRDFDRYMPQLEYILVDLAQKNIDSMVDDAHCQVVLHLMSAAATAKLLPILQAHGELIAAILSKDSGLDLIEILFRYSASIDNSIDLNSFQEIITDSVDADNRGQLMETFIEQLENKGRFERRVEGEVKMLKSMIQLKLPSASAVKLDHYSSEQLETIGQKLMTCDTLDEVLGSKR